MPTGVSWSEAFWTWLRVALLSFGGPTGQIAVMHRILVEEKRWVSEERFLHALNYCMLLPGPEATQMATYIGWLMHRTLGGLLAGLLFVLPGYVALMVLSVVYVTYGDVGIVAAIFLGLKPAVIAIVVEAVWRIGRRVLKNQMMLLIAALAFVAVFFLEVPFPLVVLVAGLVGLIGHRVAPQWFLVVKSATAQAPDEGPQPLIADGVDLPHTRPSWRRLISVVVIGAIVWFGPIVLLAWWLSPESVLVQEGVYFSKAAMVTFGGAYSVLSYVAQDAVEKYHWLRPDEMLVGLGMAETTPGPLIMVLQFVGFMGAHRDAALQDAGWPPLVSGIAGATITTWATFVPCFVWIFAGAPYVEQLRSRPSLSAALSSITAAVVGCVLNLGLWFALHVWFAVVAERNFDLLPGVLHLRLLLPQWTSLQPEAVLITLFACAVLFWWKRGLVATLAGSVALGIALWLLR